MRIRTITDLPQQWDDTSQSSTSTSNQEEEDISSSSQHSTSSNNAPNQPIPRNPYRTEPPPTLSTRIMTHLRSWILPQRIPDPPETVPINPPETDQPEIPEAPIETNDPNVPYQTSLNNNVENQHWGDKMQCPKPFNTFRVLS